MLCPFSNSPCQFAKPLRINSKLLVAEWKQGCWNSLEKWENLKLRKDEGGLDFKDLLAFKKAMLSKQAWRISQQPSSLLSQLLNGLYYPQGDFWKAGKGSKPSWGWQSIVVGRDLIAPQVMWAMGNGQTISIREDKWLRSGTRRASNKK